MHQLKVADMAKSGAAGVVSDGRNHPTPESIKVRTIAK
jgi:hypothetical protein